MAIKVQSKSKTLESLESRVNSGRVISIERTGGAVTNITRLKKGQISFDSNNAEIKKVMANHGISDKYENDQLFTKFTRFGVLDPKNTLLNTKEFVFITKPDLALLDTAPNSRSLNPVIANNANLIIDNTLFKNTHVSQESRGGVIYNTGNFKLTNSIIEDNIIAKANFQYVYGAVYNAGTFTAYSNIFNIINPADLVTYLPLSQWGFERYGVDIELPVENTDLLEAARTAYAARADQFGTFPASSDTVSATQRIVDAMAELAPDPASSATLIHAMNHPGPASADENGITANGFMLTLFEGNLFTASGTENSFSSLPQGQNDFTPLLLALQSADSGSWLMGVHMPATYGAWMAVMSNVQPYK